jgi:hypothetical protein
MNAGGCEAVVRFRAYFYTKVPLRQNVYVVIQGAQCAIDCPSQITLCD